MKLLFPLLGHLLVTLARLASPGGVRRPRSDRVENMSFWRGTLIM